MSHRSLYLWIRAAVIGVAAFGALLCVFIIPSGGKSIADSYPEFAHCFWPWLIFLWATAIPCWAVLYFAWRISSEVKADNSFSKETARLLSHISVAAFIDTAFFFVGNIVIGILFINHPGVLLVSLFVDCFGVVIGLTAAILSRFVLKAADLQEQSDLTV